MAKIKGGAKNSSTLSSNLLSKSKYKMPSKSKSKSKSTKKRPSYKEEYVKLLERTNKLFTKEIKSIRKAITIPLSPQIKDKEYITTQTPTFPISGKGNRNNKTTATINDILEQLIIIESQITQRDVILNDLMGQSGKISTDVILNDSMENKAK